MKNDTIKFGDLIYGELEKKMPKAFLDKIKNFPLGYMIIGEGLKEIGNRFCSFGAEHYTPPQILEQRLKQQRKALGTGE